MKNIIVILVLSLAILSCSKDDQQPDQPSKVTDVYLLGMEYNGNAYQAKYWKNGTPTLLNIDANKPVDVSDMVVSGNDVYVAGNEYNGVKNEAYYWKNGTRINLPSIGIYTAYVTGIAVLGTDVYVSGYQLTATNAKAVYWKNGVINLLSDGTSYNIANDIALSGQNVCVIGGTQTAPDFFESKIWINGVPKTISNLDSRVSSIFVSGNNIYIAGKEKSNLGVFAAKYWILNTLTDTFTKVDIGTFGLSFANSIFVSAGGDVYVAGYERNSAGTDFAKYWKNGQVTTLSNGTKDAYCSSIMVDGNDVYVSGNDGNVIKHWKNNVATSYTDGARLAFAKTVFAITR